MEIEMEMEIEIEIGIGDTIIRSKKFLRFQPGQKGRLHQNNAFAKHWELSIGSTSNTSMAIFHNEKWKTPISSSSSSCPSENCSLSSNRYCWGDRLFVCIFIYIYWIIFYIMASSTLWLISFICIICIYQLFMIILFLVVH